MPVIEEIETPSQVERVFGGSARRSALRNASSVFLRHEQTICPSSECFGERPWFRIANLPISASQDTSHRFSNIEFARTAVLAAGPVLLEAPL